MDELAKSLSILLADIYALAIKSQNFHWNIQGQEFYYLHLLFERVYNAVAEDIDPVAENLRGMGYRAPATLKLFQNLSTISETDNIPSPNEMVSILLADVRAVVITLDNTAAACVAVKKQGTLNMVTGILEKYDSLIYLLGSQAGVL